MLNVTVKANESIDRALKRLKKKLQNTNLIKELRANQYFEKPSVAKRIKKKKAVYKQQQQSND